MRTFAMLVVLAAALVSVRSDQGRTTYRTPRAAVAHASVSALESKRSTSLEQPVRFEENVGQFAPEIRYAAHAGDAVVLLTDAGATLIRGSARTGRAAEPERTVMLRLPGSARVRPLASDQLTTKTSYFLGSDRSRWRSNVTNFGRVTYHDVRPGIDLVLHGEDGSLEYDFVVAPGARAEDAELDLVGTLGEELRRSPPRIYQVDGSGTRRYLDGRYRDVADRIAFEVPEYDHERALVIDPYLPTLSTYLGGTGSDSGISVASDYNGDIYLAGSTMSTDFPVVDPLQTTFGGYVDVFVAALSAGATAYSYVTYIGGSGLDTPTGIALDDDGTLVTGYVTSKNFPTVGAYQGSLNGSGDAFVLRLASNGASLGYSTYLGGSSDDQSLGVATDGIHAFVTGLTQSTDFPTVQAAQSTQHGSSDGFVTALASDGASLVFSTYLGGSEEDVAVSIAVNQFVWVVGRTVSSDFPTMNPFKSQLSGQGDSDAFVTRFLGDGEIALSSYLGGNAVDQATSVAADPEEGAVITGITESTDLPTNADSFQQKLAGQQDGFLVEMGPDAVIETSYIGGTSVDAPHTIAYERDGHIVVAGATYSADFPLVNPLQATRGGTEDAFVASFDDIVTGLKFSSYLGGADADYASGVTSDGDGNLFLTGTTASTDFPVTSPLQATNAGTGYDAFLVRLERQVALAPSTAAVSPLGTLQFSVQDGRVGTFSLATNNSHGSVDADAIQYTAGATGGVTDVVEYKEEDGQTTTATVVVGPGVAISPDPAEVAASGSVTFTASGGSGTGYVWSLSANPSGGSIDSARGTYVAGPVAPATDTVSVVDSLGNAAQLAITVTVDTSGATDASAPGVDAGAATDAGDAGEPTEAGAVHDEDASSAPGSAVPSDAGAVASVPAVADASVAADASASSAPVARADDDAGGCSLAHERHGALGDVAAIVLAAGALTAARRRRRQTSLR